MKSQTEELAKASEPSVIGRSARGILAFFFVTIVIFLLFWAFSDRAIGLFAITCFLMAIVVPKFLQLDSRTVDFFYYSIALLGIVGFASDHEGAARKLLVEQDSRLLLEQKGGLVEAALQLERGQFEKVYANELADYFVSNIATLEEVTRIERTECERDASKSCTSKWKDLQSILLFVASKRFVDQENSAMLYEANSAFDRTKIILALQDEKEKDSAKRYDNATKFLKALSGLDRESLMNYFDRSGELAFDYLYVSRYEDQIVRVLPSALISILFPPWDGEAEGILLSQLSKEIELLDAQIQSLDGNEKLYGPEVRPWFGIYILTMAWPYILCLLAAIKLARFDYLGNLKIPERTGELRPEPKAVQDSGKTKSKGITSESETNSGETGGT